MSSGVMQSTADFCPVENSTFTQSKATNETDHHAFDWSIKQRGLMLGAFFLGQTLSAFTVGPLLRVFDVRHSITLVLL